MTETGSGSQSPEQALRGGAAQLAELHPELDAVLVERIVFESHAMLARGARVKTHLVPLAISFATDRLQALERGGRRGEGGPLRIYIESTRNDGISQMAAAYLNALGGGRVDALSGGTGPADVVLRTVADVMEEQGVTLTGSYPKPVTDDLARAADVVVTMLIAHPFPLAAGQAIESWDFDDPAGRGTDEVRRIRDRVRRRVQEFLDALED